MSRFPLAPFTKGLSTLADEAAGDPQSLVEAGDVRGHTGILTLRKGYRILDIEPSHVNDSGGTTKTRAFLLFDASNDNASNTSWTQTLGQKWTIRWEMNFATLGASFTNGNRVALHITGAGFDPVKITLIGNTAAATCQISVAIQDNLGNTVTLTSTARTSAAWLAAFENGSARYLKITRDGITLNLYVGETLEDTDSTFTTNAHEAGVALYVGSDSTPGNYAAIAIYSSLVIVNRLLTEYESYWGIGYPTDSEAEPDVLGNWPFNDLTGTTVKDYSSYAKNLTISGATWTNSSHVSARGLGIGSWRRANGDIYHALASTRRGTSSAGAAPSGVVYTWKASETFLPFYFGGDPANDDATAGLTGLNAFARVDFQQGRDMLLLCNGYDFCRKRRTTFQYMGGTAPPTAPVVVTAGGAGTTATWIYAYSYFNSLTKTETGLSPFTTITITDDAGTTVNWFVSSDTQFDRVRIYRSKTGEAGLYLLTEQTMAAGSYADNPAKTDANLAAGPLCPGADISGNRGRKRAFIGFPDFRQDDPVEGPRKGPVTAPTLAQSGSSSVNNGVHYIAYSYYDSTNDVETGMSPAAAITVTGNQQIDISALVLPPEGSRYDQMRIYRTKAGAWEWFRAQTLNVATTATETQADSALTTTVETMALPPKFRGMAVFANRLWGFVGDRLYWSTAGFLEDHPEANAFSPKAGVHIRAISPTEGALFVHFEDGTIHLLPHPGDEPDLSYFVPLNLRQWSPRNAAVGHFTVQAVPGGLVWLARDGFFFANPGTLQHISRMITPEFLNLNAARGEYACSLYDGTRDIYRCWVSRGNKRLNEECFVFYVREGTWWLDNLHADMAGILYDGKENPHYCFLMENGVLCELDETLEQDGDGGGTQEGAVSDASPTHFAAIGGYTEPTGGDGGYPVWFVKSDGTIAQRFILDSGVAIPADDVTFYPSLVGLTSGSWTAYLNGIRGYFKTMLLHLGDMRLPKNLNRVFFFNRKQSAGGLQANISADEAALTSMDSDVDLTIPVSQITTMVGSGRVFQFEVYSDPPAASRPWGLKGMEMEAVVDESDVGTD